MKGEKTPQTLHVTLDHAMHIENKIVLLFVLLCLYFFSIKPNSACSYNQMGNIGFYQISNMFVVLAVLQLSCNTHYTDAHFNSLIGSFYKRPKRSSCFPYEYISSVMKLR